MGFLFTSGNKERTVALFDIGSDCVKGAIVKIPADEKSLPTIVKSTRTDIAYRDELDYDLYLGDMIKALTETAHNLYNAKMGTVNEVTCIMASPWYLSETRTVKITRDTSFVFTQKIASDLLDKEIATLSEEYKKRYGDASIMPQVIEHHIMGVLLNGYPVTDPIGKHTKSIDMNIVTSLSSQACLDKIKDVMSKTFTHAKVSFSSFIVSSYFVIRDKYPNVESYLLINIGGEITDVGIVSGGILKASLSFPFGKKTLYKKISNSLGIELRDTEEMFSLYTKGTLDEVRKQKLSIVLKSIENGWGESFRQCINTLTHTFTLPSTIFLTVSQEIRNWFKEVVCNQEYVQPTVSGHKCAVVTLDGQEFLDMCHYEDGECDPLLIMGAISIMKKLDK